MPIIIFDFFVVFGCCWINTDVSAHPPVVAGAAFLIKGRKGRAFKKKKEAKNKDTIKKKNDVCVCAIDEFSGIIA